MNTPPVVARVFDLVHMRACSAIGSAWQAFLQAGVGQIADPTASGIGVGGRFTLPRNEMFFHHAE